MSQLVANLTGRHSKKMIPASLIKHDSENRRAGFASMRTHQTASKSCLEQQSFSDLQRAPKVFCMISDPRTAEHKTDH